MKRDMELIREILMRMESMPDDWEEEIDVSSSESNGNKLYQHLRMMQKAGLIDGTDLVFLDSSEFHPLSLTWQGYDFLDTIRDPEIWAKTKAIGDKSGAFTLDLLSEIAKGLIKTQIKKYTGVET